MGTPVPPDDANVPVIVPPIALVHDTTDPLAATKVVTTSKVIELTDGERIDRLEKTVRDMLNNPSGGEESADAAHARIDAMSTKVDQANGKSDSAIAQVAAMSNTLPDRMDRVEARMTNAEVDVQKIATAKDIKLTEQPYNEDHQNATRNREFTCPTDGTSWSDIVPTNAIINAERSCPTCGKAVTETTSPSFSITTA